MADEKPKESRTPYNPHEARQAAKAAREAALAAGNPVPLGKDGDPAPEGYVLAGDLGPGETVEVPKAIQSTRWTGVAPNEMVWLTFSDGSSAGPYAKSQALRKGA